jgi:hypothetical protein
MLDLGDAKFDAFSVFWQGFLAHRQYLLFSHQRNSRRRPIEIATQNVWDQGLSTVMDVSTFATDS